VNRKILKQATKIFVILANASLLFIGTLGVVHICRPVKGDETLSKLGAEAGLAFACFAIREAIFNRRSDGKE